MPADYTAGEVDECLVGEVHSLLLAVESCALVGVVWVGGEASAIGEEVAVLRHLDEVIADGHADGVLAIQVCLYDFPILRADGAVDIECDVFYGIVGTGIAYLSADGERRDILKVNAAVNERRCADESRLLVGGKLMDAHCGDDAVGSAVAREGHAADGVVAVDVGIGHLAQLVVRRQVLRAVGCYLRRGVAPVGDAVGLREVVGNGLHLEAFVQGIVDGQPVFVACQRMVVVALHIKVGKILGE